MLILFNQIYRTEEDFLDKCPCGYKIIKFVENIKDTDVLWFFDICYSYYDRILKVETHQAIFKSYITEEYKDYVLSIKAEKIDGSYSLSITKKVDNLLSDTV